MKRLRFWFERHPDGALDLTRIACLTFLGVVYGVSTGRYVRDPLLMLFGGICGAALWRACRYVAAKMRT